MSTEELEDELSRPSGADVEFLRQLEGDILILGAGGKMGPSLARLCRRAADAAGGARRIVGGSRRVVAAPGIDWLGCDLLDRAQGARLPHCPNGLFPAEPHRGVLYRQRICAASRGGGWRARDGRAGAGGRVCAELPGPGAGLRVLRQVPRTALPVLPPQLRGGSALRRAGGYRAQGACGGAG